MMKAIDAEGQRRAQLAARRAELSSAKRVRLDQALQRAASRGSEKGVIPRRPQQQQAPLSFAQQRLWFLDQLDPGRALYNMPAAVRLAGLLNIAGLTQGLSEIVRRHESLRTNFATLNGQAVQVISPEQTLRLPVVDLGGLTESEWQRWAQQLASEESQRPFDLAGESLLRVALLRRTGQEHVVLITMHHIVSDAWSWGNSSRR